MSTLMNQYGLDVPKGVEWLVGKAGERLSRGAEARPKIPGSRTTSAPVAFAETFQSRYSYHGDGKKCVCIGEEMLVDGVPYYSSRSGVDFVYPLNPAAWQGTHVSQIAQIFTFFKIRKLELIYVPKVGTSTAGTITMGFTASELEPGDAYEVLANTNGAVTSSVWTPCRADLAKVKFPQVVYDTYTPGYEPDWPATMMLASQGIPNSTVYGTLLVKYEIAFELPCWDGRVFSSTPYSATSLVQYYASGHNLKVSNTIRTAILNKEVVCFINNATAWTTASMFFGNSTASKKNVRVGDCVFVSDLGAADSAGAGYATITLDGGTKGFLQFVTGATTQEVGITWYTMDLSIDPGYTATKLLNPSRAWSYAQSMMKPGSKEQADAISYLTSLRIVPIELTPTTEEIEHLRYRRSKAWEEAVQPSCSACPQDQWPSGATGSSSGGGSSSTGGPPLPPPLTPQWKDCVFKSSCSAVDKDCLERMWGSSLLPGSVKVAYTADGMLGAIKEIDRLRATLEGSHPDCGDFPCWAVMPAALGPSVQLSGAPPRASTTTTESASSTTSTTSAPAPSPLKKQ